MDLSIRVGSEADLPACLAIDDSIATEWVLYLERLRAEPELSFRLGWRRVAAGRRRDLEVNQDFLRRWLRSGGRLLVAEVDGEIRGRMLLCEMWNRTLGVEDVAVDLSHRRQGFGEALLAEARRIAREAGLRAISWEAQTDNRGAIEFLLANGFRLSGFDHMHYHNDGYESQLAPDFRGLALFFTLPLE